MRKSENPPEPRTEKRKAPYERPHIESEEVFETQSLVTCPKVGGDPGCAQDGFNAS